MISRQKISELKLKTIDEYYKYIVDCIVEGDTLKALDLVEDMSVKQKKQAILCFQQIEAKGSKAAAEAKQIIFLSF